MDRKPLPAPFPKGAIMDTDWMDRKPLPPPFPKGARVRYVGTRYLGTFDGQGNEVPIRAPGLVVTVKETKLGYRGTLTPVRGDWEPHEYDAPALDQTVDGYSVYEVDVPGRQPIGRIIWPADADEWEMAGE